MEQNKRLLYYSWYTLYREVGEWHRDPKNSWDVVERASKEENDKDMLNEQNYTNIVWQYW